MVTHVRDHPCCLCAHPAV